MNNLIYLAVDCSSPEFDQLFNILHTAYFLILVTIPVGLIIFGTIDLAKAIMSSKKEDDITAAKDKLKNKFLALVLVLLLHFFILTVLSVIAPDSQNSDDAIVSGEAKSSIITCLDRVVSGD